jgi:deoxycytidylate deaminase
MSIINIDFTFNKNKIKLTERHIKVLAETALKSQMMFQHACIIILDGEIIAKGFNYQVSKSDRFIKYRKSIHAEMQAINCAKQQYKDNYKSVLARATLVVIRIARAKVTHKGIWIAFKNSVPCHKCTERINASGIKNVAYSIGTPIK